MSTLDVPMFGQNFRPRKLQHSGFFWADLPAMKVDFQQIRVCPNTYVIFFQQKLNHSFGGKAKAKGLADMNSSHTRIFEAQSTVAGVFSPEVSA